MPLPTVHACAVLVGARAVLIQGPSGCGKSQLALGLIEAAQTGILPFARLVADDRAEVEAAHGRLLVRPPPALAGLIEVGEVGIRQTAYERVAIAGLIVDLAAADADRMPEPASKGRKIEGITLPRLA